MFSSNTSQVSSAANYIEDSFSTTLYSGTGSTRTVTTGVDTTLGGLIWIRKRNDVEDHYLYRNNSKVLFSDTSDAEYTQTNSNYQVVRSTTGFSINLSHNASGGNYVAWSFKPL